MARSFTRFMRENDWKRASEDSMPDLGNALVDLPKRLHPSDRGLFAEYVGTYQQAVGLTYDLTFGEKVEEFFQPRLRRERLAAREFYRRAIAYQTLRYHEVCRRLDAEART